MQYAKQYSAEAEQLAHALAGNKAGAFQSAVSHGLAYAALPLHWGLSFATRGAGGGIHPNSGGERAGPKELPAVTNSSMSGRNGKKKQQTRKGTKPPARRGGPPRGRGGGRQRGRGGPAARTRSNPQPVIKIGKVNERKILTHPPTDVGYIGSSGTSIEWYTPKGLNGCTGLRVKYLAATVGYDGAGTPPKIRLDLPDGTNKSNGALPLAPWNSRYVPQQIASLVDLFERWDCEAMMYYQPTSTIGTQNYRLTGAYIPDPCAVASQYGVLLETDVASYSAVTRRTDSNACPHYGEVGGPVSFGGTTRMAFKRDGMKFTSGQFDSGDSIYYDTDDAADLRDQVKGAWLFAMTSGSTSLFQGLGELHVVINLILCDFSQSPIADAVFLRHKNERKVQKQALKLLAREYAERHGLTVDEAPLAQTVLEESKDALETASVVSFKHTPTPSRSSSKTR